MLGEMQKLLRDQCGAVAPFLAGTIFLLVGIGALAVELPRMANFTTDLQNAADAAALAGAAGSWAIEFVAFSSYSSSGKRKHVVVPCA